MNCEQNANALLKFTQRKIHNVFIKSNTITREKGEINVVLT